MKYSDWEPIYFEIIRFFNYSLAEDQRAAETLVHIIDESHRLDDPERWLTSKISGKDAIIIGPCISSSEIGQMLTSGEITDLKIVATVGEGTKNAMEIGLVPDLVVTDLDSYPEFELQSNIKGAVAIIHGHGDNISLMKNWLPKFKKRVIPTCQCLPPHGAYNWGGFTDGDRAYCILHHFNATSISLLGFDFERLCGSKQPSNNSKIEKLQWAKSIIERVSKI